MHAYSRGTAVIRHAKTGRIFSIDGDDLDWQPFASDEHPTGEHLHHYAQLEHPDLGVLAWNVWEYPQGVVSNRQTEPNGHIVETDLDYGLEHGVDDPEIAGQVAELVEWFHSNYEDPAQHTSYNGREGGYLWNHGGPYDAREELSDNFPNVPEHVLDAAVSEIESDGLTEWAGVDSGLNDDGVYSVDDPLPDLSGESFDDEEDEEVPRQRAGIAFRFGESGLIELLPTGFAIQADAAQIAILREASVGALMDLEALLVGSNAYATIAVAAASYRAALASEPPSIDLIYALGVRLENARSRLQQEVATGDYPQLAPAAGEALDSVIGIHGPILLSTTRGRELYDLSREYSSSADRTQVYKGVADAVVQAIAEARDMVGEEVRGAITTVNSDLAFAADPPRTAHVAHTANRNILVTIARAALLSAGGLAVGAVVSDGFLASVPGSMATEAITSGFNLAWDFMLANAPALREFAAVSGPDMRWLPSLIERLEGARARGWLF